MDLIKQLAQDRRFYGTCTKCGKDFQLCGAVMFRVNEPFPAEAVEKIKQLRKEIQARRDNIKRQKLLARDKAAITTESVNVGKMLEQIAPSFSSFMYSPRDCRSLFEPIDYLIFPGLTKQRKVDSVVFAEVKSGQARLTNVQRDIRQIVRAGEVAFQTRGRNGR
jgi:predicted Holliday junction resolvase-like endonuclease